MTEIVVEIYRGTVTHVYSSSRNVRAIIIDWDLISQGDGKAEAGYLIACLPLAELRGRAAAEAHRVKGEDRNPQSIPPS